LVFTENIGEAMPDAAAQIRRGRATTIRKALGAPRFSPYLFLRFLCLFAAIPVFSRTPITAFETTATGILNFSSTVHEDGSDIYEDRKVTTRAEPISADRERQEEAVVLSTSEDCQT
jgi:hypothetical protein